MDVTIQFIVNIEVALVLQRRPARGTPEAIDMQVFVLNPNKNATIRSFRPGIIIFGWGRPGTVVLVNIQSNDEGRGYGIERANIRIRTLIEVNTEEQKSKESVRIHTNFGTKLIYM